MFSSLLVPLDGSEFSEEALPLAGLLGRSLGSQIHLVHVIRPAPDADLKSPQEDLDWKQKVRAGAEEYLGELAAAFREEGIQVQTDVLEGPVVDALGEHLEDRGIPLVVMTTHGSGGFRRWWLGSVADGLLRRGPGNLLLVRPWDDTEDRPREDPRFRHLVVPLDGSIEGEAALGPARELARTFGADRTYLRAIPAPVELTSIYGMAGVRFEGEGHRTRRAEAEEYLEAVLEREENDGVEKPAAQVVEHRHAADGVIEAAHKLDGDLLVLSSHGRGGLTRMVLGSVADKVIRGTTLPVLVIRPPDAD
jgi:nucleotide-binding universal stress UspA family protein